MRTTVALLLVAVMPGLAAAQDEPQTPGHDSATDSKQQADRFAPVGDLAGHCWIGPFPDGKARDLHCYEWVLQNRFLRDRHRVMGPDGVYEGDTYYRWNEESAALEFWYFNSLGGVSTGTVAKQGGRWLFSEDYEEADASAQQIRSFLGRDDDKSYTVTSERLQDGTWTPLWSMRLTRTDVQAVTLGGDWAEQWDLVFNTNRDENYEVYRRDLMTGAERNLTDSPTTEWAYAAEDKQLTIVSNRQAGNEHGYRLYRTDPDSGKLAQLSQLVVADSWVGHLPNNGGLVLCAREKGDRELYLLDPDGSIVRQLTDNDAEDCQPDVTPDGKTVIFWSDRSGSGELWAMGLDGSNARQLTRFPGNDGASTHRYRGEGPARISPDGKRIVWMSIRNGEDWDIYTMAIDGRDVRRLTDRLSDDGYPSWSPDGRYIVFDSDRAGSFDVYLMLADGSGMRRLTDHPAYEQAPLLIPKSTERGQQDREDTTTE